MIRFHHLGLRSPSFVNEVRLYSVNALHGLTRQTKPMATLPLPKSVVVYSLGIQPFLRYINAPVGLEVEPDSHQH